MNMFPLCWFLYNGKSNNYEKEKLTKILFCKEKRQKTWNPSFLIYNTHATDKQFNTVFLTYPGPQLPVSINIGQAIDG